MSLPQFGRSERGRSISRQMQLTRNRVGGPHSILSGCAFPPCNQQSLIPNSSLEPEPARSGSFQVLALLCSVRLWPISATKMTPSLTWEADAEQGPDGPLPSTPPQVPVAVVESLEEEETLPLHPLQRQHSGNLRLQQFRWYWRSCNLSN